MNTSTPTMRAATSAEQLPHRGQLRHLGLTVTPPWQVIESCQWKLCHLGSWLSHATLLDGWATKWGYYSTSATISIDGCTTPAIAFNHLNHHQPQGSRGSLSSALLLSLDLKHKWLRHQRDWIRLPLISIFCRVSSGTSRDQATCRFQLPLRPSSTSQDNACCLLSRSNRVGVFFPLFIEQPTLELTKSIL